MMGFKEIGPGRVAKLRRPLRRPDDVGEEHRHQNPIRSGSWSDAGEKLLDLAQNLFGVADPGQVVIAGQLHVSRARYPLGKVAAGACGNHAILVPVQHERRHADGGKDGSNVDLCVHHGKRNHRRGARTESEVARPGLAEAGVVRLARRSRLEPHRAAPATAHLVDECLVLGHHESGSLPRHQRTLGSGR